VIARIDPKRILLLPGPQSVRIWDYSDKFLSHEQNVTIVEPQLFQGRYDMYASKTFRRLVLAVIVVVSVVMTTLAVRAPVTAVQAPALRSMATMSGTVSSSKPFKAAQVYIRNVDMRILYMVFTNAGQFRAVSLFPGNYEIVVTAKGLKSDVRKLTLKAGDNPKVNLSLQEVAISNQAEANPFQNLETLAASSVKVSFDTYENIYPPGPGRDVAERTCIICHGENFIPTQPARP